MIPATEDEVSRSMRYIEVLHSGCWSWAGARSRGTAAGSLW